MINFHQDIVLFFKIDTIPQFESMWLYAYNATLVQLNLFNCLNYISSAYNHVILAILCFILLIMKASALGNAERWVC